MNETWLTVVGNVATAPDFREPAGGVPAVRFRLAVSARRWDRERQLWTDGPTSFYTVWAWRSLAVHLAGSVSLGEPLVVHGRLRVTERVEERIEEPAAGSGGARRWVAAEIEAVAVGHDLARGTSAFRRVSAAKPLVSAPTGTTAP